MGAFSKRTLYSLIIVLLWLGFVVDGAHALFVSEATLTGTSISSGTSTLLISNSQTTDPDTFESTRPGFPDTLIPGETVEKYLYLKNESGNTVNFDLSLLAIGEGGNSSNIRGLTLGLFPVDEAGHTSEEGFERPITDVLTQALPTGFTLQHGATQRYVLRITLDPDWSLQSYQMAFDLVFIGTQHLSS